ncbi:MAG: alanine racemase [Opitutia bacterium AMD-G1]|nr:MAG: alanine racemase [Opitutae bacterium AMD-G1]
MGASSHASAARAWVEIDLPAIDRNVGRIKQALPPHVRYVAVVKANAYGHGMPEVATRLLQAGVDCFAVANVAEAANLREVGHDADILLLSPTLPSELPRALALDLDITLNSLEEAQALAAAVAKSGLKAKVHVKVDTGMGRAGVWHEQAAELFAFVQAAGFEWRGVFTHFSDADSDAAYTTNQRAIFLKLLERIPAAVRSGLMIHADNSAGLESFSASAPFNAVRVGLMQYGLPPSSGSFLASLRPEPVLSFHARVVLVKDLPAGTAVSYNRTKTLSRPTRVAIVAVGYGDGVPTAASNRGFFLVRGQRCPILGRVTMDQTIVDITDVPSVAVGDIATILGAQRADRITVAEFCAWADCIPWEALCTLTQRVQRVYRTDRT